MAQLLSCIGSHMLVAVRPLVRRRTGTSSSGKSTQVLHDFRGGTCRLQSWSKVMVHLVFFDNFTVPSPLPPYNVGSVRSKCPPWSNIVWGGRGEGQVWEKSRFYYRTGGDDENKANFQGVPYTFDQDCTSEFKCLKMSRWITHAKKSVTSHQYSCFMRILQCSCVTRDLFELPFVFLVDSMKRVFKPCKSPFQVPKHLIIILQFVLQYHTKASLLLYS